MCYTFVEIFENLMEIFENLMFCRPYAFISVITYTKVSINGMASVITVVVFFVFVFFCFVFYIGYEEYKKCFSFLLMMRCVTPT